MLFQPATFFTKELLMIIPTMSFSEKGNLILPIESSLLWSYKSFEEYQIKWNGTIWDESIKVESRFDSLMELLDCRQRCSGYWNDFKFCKRKTTAMRKRQLRRRPILTAAEFVIKNPKMTIIFSVFGSTGQGQYLVVKELNWTFWQWPAYRPWQLISVAKSQ